MKQRHSHESDGGTSTRTKACTHRKPQQVQSKEYVAHRAQLNSDEDDELDKDFGLDGGANAEKMPEDNNE